MMYVDRYQMKTIILCERDIVRNGQRLKQTKDAFGQTKG